LIHPQWDGYAARGAPALPDRKPPPTPEDFPHLVTDNIRFGDMDAQGHVNNIVIADFFQTGRVVMFRQPDLSVGVEDATIVLAHTEITFLRELRWPGTVEIGTGVADVGRASYTVAHGLFHEGHCAAFGRATIVMIDNASRRARPLPPEFIARIEPWKYRGP
jgi:acyl-CoA thioester hydrolase